MKTVAARESDQSDLDGIYTTITGTAVQRGAGERVAYHLEEDPFTDCMHQTGIAYTPIPFVDAWSDWPEVSSGAFSTNWLASLTDQDHLIKVVQGEAEAQRAVAADQTAADEAYASLSDSDRTAWDEAANSCHEGKDAGEAWHPSGYYPLIAKYRDLVGGVDVSLEGRYRDAYHECMKPNGYEVVDHMDLVDDLRATAPPIDEIPPVGNPGGQQWQVWVDSVHAASQADAACRRAAYDAGWAILSPEVPTFQQDNAQALADEEAGWENLVAQAAMS